MTARRRLPDAPGCRDWNRAIRRARAAYAEQPPGRYCEYIDDDGHLCFNEAQRRRYCAGHADVAG